MGDNNTEILRNFIKYAELDKTEKEAIETLINRTQSMEYNIGVMSTQEQEMKMLIDMMAQEIYLMSKEDYKNNAPYENSEQVKARFISELKPEQL